MTLAVDVVADGAVVAVAPLLAVQVVASRGAGVGAHGTLTIGAGFTRE